MSFINIFHHFLLHVLQTAIRLATLNLLHDMAKILVQFFLVFVILGRLARG